MHTYKHVFKYSHFKRRLETPRFHGDSIGSSVSHPEMAAGGLVSPTCLLSGRMRTLLPAMTGGMLPGLLTRGQESHSASPTQDNFHTIAWLTDSVFVLTFVGGNKGARS